MISIQFGNEMLCKEARLALRDAIELLSGKWKICILQQLEFGEKRFKDLQEVVVGISPKVLTKELLELEQNLLITRTVNNTKPITVSYAITPFALEAQAVYDALLTFGIQQRKRIKEAVAGNGALEKVG
ncbi:helix-turn-helix domain-containing protein [Chitinophaga sp. Cy-1792]|uniref:winged helix-turn-helix transcriptional regulator n=1 Tax=Chitinophaga sp. Cy-1792 TaxID=2608339 RepID=UPI00141DCDA4|nr:helix-turn-helix domain-containing protein [Chitinophaga sp. Cy-1792]NIG53331.1 helix-turn-helix transcriptional regulator [Chitinophaga sp. Cy-1792]